MRLWIASLLVGTGCNQIFGATNVGLLPPDDAAPLADAAPNSMMITGMAFNSAKVADPVTYPVLPGVTAELGAMPAATASGFPVLANAPLDVTGTFQVPFELSQSAYRIVYHPPDGVPVEYQTSVHGFPGHFIANIDLGRPERIPAPPTAAMDISAANEQDPMTAGRLIETGSWASFYLGTRSGGTANSIGLAWSTTIPSQVTSSVTTTVTSHVGALGSPETGKGDRLLLVDATNPANPGLADTYSVVTMDGFNGATANNLTATPWTTATTASMAAASYTAAPGLALAASRVNDSTRTNMVSDDDNLVGGHNVPFVWSGVIPSMALPNFVTSGAGGKAIPPAEVNGAGGLGIPMFAFMSTRVSELQLPYVNVFDGTIAPKFPQAIFARVSRSRTTHNVKVTEGIQSIALTNLTTAAVDLATGQAYQAGAHMMLNNTDIWFADSISAVVPRAALMTFTFGVDGVVDDCVSTLYSVTNSAYVPVRRYLMPATANHGSPSGIVVDNQVILKNQDYVLGVACHLGYPDAVNGDWSVVKYPFSESVVYSFPFVVITDPV